MAGVKTDLRTCAGGDLCMERACTGRTPKAIEEAEYKS